MVAALRAILDGALENVTDEVEVEAETPALSRLGVDVDGELLTITDQSRVCWRMTTLLP